MLGREDPFFAVKKPHTNGYLEALHRTYGEPKSALPTRNDDLFRRAYEFRQREKAKYSELENDLKHSRAQFELLKLETDKMRSLFEQLSRPEANVSASNRATATDELHPGPNDHKDSNKGVDQRAAPSDGRSPSDGDEGLHAAPVKEDSKGRVSKQVLHRDSRGRSEEHPVEGSESGSGSAGGEGAGGHDEGAGESDE